MGQTGAGKTTMVDSLLNFLLGIEYYDKFRYKLVDESALQQERINQSAKVGASEKEQAKAA